MISGSPTELPTPNLRPMSGKGQELWNPFIPAKIFIINGLLIAMMNRRYIQRRVILIALESVVICSHFPSYSLPGP